MPEFTIDQLTTALAIVAGVALIAFVIALFLVLRLRRLRREYRLLRGPAGEEDVLGAVARALRKVDDMGRRIDSVWAQQQGQGNVGRLALQRYGVVRYDAFEEMGGRLSFSLALLDDHGDGIVLSSINGRTETRTYAKEVRRLTSEHNLSQEERDAIAAAMANFNRESPTAVTEAR